jgi:hypothetical protein
MAIEHKHKSIFISVFGISLLFLATALYFFSQELFYVSEEKPVIKTDQFNLLDYKNIAYIIDTEPVKLSNGSFKGLGPDEPVSVDIFGNESYGDLNGDGLTDVTFTLVEDTGGTGSFYYVAAALRGKDGYVGTNAVFLGDRIYPQSIEVHEGQVIVNYADRRPNEPFTAQPTVNMSKYLKVVGEKLTDINI